jgi:hypothetical protein
MGQGLAGADHAVVMKEAATRESKEDWHARDSGWWDKNGRVIRGLRKLVNWEWTEMHEMSFHALKNATIKNAVYGKEELVQYHLATDASKTGIGRALEQRRQIGNGCEK